MLDPRSLDCPSASTAGSSEPALAEAVDRLAARLRRGERLDLDWEIAQYAQCADSLRMLLPTLEALALAGQNVPDEGSTAEITPDAAAELPHPRQLGDFELVREVGRGGMGIVYEARQLSLGRRVAVKVLPAASLLDARQLQRFKNEARAAAQLNHSHIVDVLCVGCDEGVHYFAMRFVAGRTLAEAIAQASGTRECAGNSGISEEVRAEAQCKLQSANCTIPNDANKTQTRQAVEWIAQAAEALDHAHASGIVHRDVKPSNLLIDGEGKLWVSDFGVARFGDDAGLTLTGDLLGTLRYMSPEQALGRLAEIGPRSDVYSLGATLYELLASRPVFAGDDRGEVLRQVAFAEPMALRKVEPRLPRDLETIVHKALEKSPEDRYGIAGEMARDLRRFLRGEPILATPPTLAERAAKWCLRRRRWVAAAVVTLVLAVAGLSVGTLLISRSRSEALAARKLVEDRDRENRRMLSAIETRLALQAYQRGELTRAGELLKRQVPGSGTSESSSTRADADNVSFTRHSQAGAQGERAATADDFRDFTWYWLQGAIRARLPLAGSFDGYPSEVYSVDYSPDGALLATATFQKIIVREASSGAIRYTVEAHASDVNCARFSPDGTLLASVGEDCRVRLWRAADGEPVADLGSHEPHPAYCAAFSPDGRWLATGADPVHCACGTWPTDRK